MNKKQVKRARLVINNYFSLGWVIFLIIIPFIVHFKETTLYGSWGILIMFLLILLLVSYILLIVSLVTESLEVEYE
ncbi:MAG: hypothetical protein AABW56_01470 [Nanoarchaeota archaeon]